MIFRFINKVSLDNICENTPDTSIDICPSLGTTMAQARLLKRSSLLIKLKDIYNSKAKGEGRYISFSSLDGYSMTYPAYRDSRNECTCAQSDLRVR